MPRERRRRLFEILESGATGDTTRRAFDALMCLLIVSNVVATTVETLGPVYQRYAPAFDLFEKFSVAVFTLEANRIRPDMMINAPSSARRSSYTTRPRDSSAGE